MKKEWITPTGADAQKWEHIFQRYHKLLYYKALQMMHNQQDAEDILQDTFVKISQNLEKIEDIDSNKTYCYIMTILRNNARDIFRRRKQHPEVEWEDNKEIAEHIEDNDAETIAFSKLSFECWMECIEKLKDKYRLPFLLKYGAGCSIEEISAMLGLEKPAVSMRILRAKRKLQQLAQKEEGGEKVEK